MEVDEFKVNLGIIKNSSVITDLELIQCERRKIGVEV